MTTTLGASLELPRGQRLPNRIAKSAMSERLGDRDGAPTRELVSLYERWGRGGAGLLVTGNVMVDGTALGEPGNVVVEDDRHLGALRAWSAVARSHGARAWMQINHPGRQSPRFLSREPVAPSAVPVRGAGGAFARPRALEDREIGRIVEAFGRAAAVAERAGFDGVQIHGAHGYLVSQFLSPLVNRRTDRWGGSPEGRRRFLLEVVRAVRSAVSPRFGGFSHARCLLQFNEFHKYTVDEHSIRAVEEATEMLDDQGLDLLEISGGTYESTAMFEETVPRRDSSRAREAFFLDYAEAVRERVRTPLMLTGGFRTKTGMEHALHGGAVDVVGLARPLAVEPDLPARVLAGAAEQATAVRLATGIAKLDAVVQAMWYQAQIDRMGRGRAPHPGMSRWWGLLRYVLPRPAPKPVALPAPTVATPA